MSQIDIHLSSIISQTGLRVLLYFIAVFILLQLWFYMQ